MILLDTMLVGGIRFVLDKIVSAVDQEMNDESRLREELLAAQMRLELGEITDAEFAEVEADLLARLRAIQKQRRAESETAADYRVTGVEATVAGDDGPIEAAARPPARVPAKQRRGRKRRT